MFKHSMRTAVLIMALVTIGVVGTVSATAGTVVVANSAVPADGVSQGDLQQIFLGKQTSWGDGTSIELGVLSGGPVADEFLKTYVKKSPSQFQTFWKKAVFSGTGTAPQEFGSGADLVAWVAATPGAIGFAEDGAATDGCKVLAIQ